MLANIMLEKVHPTISPSTVWYRYPLLSDLGSASRQNIAMVCLRRSPLRYDVIDDSQN